MKKLIVILSIISMTALSCDDTNKKSPSPRPPQTTAQKVKEVPAFNADSAYQYVKSQVDFGPRVPNTPEALACAEYLSFTLGRFADTVYLQDFKIYAYDQKTILNGRNIIGVFNPDNKKRILLAAHWDSRPFADHDHDPANHRKPILGANDGASGVGVLLEIARQMSLSAPNIGVDIIFFDVEDYGTPRDAQNQSNDTWGLGSQHWSKMHHITNYQANYGILLDMVGDHNAIFPKEAFSEYFAKNIVKKVWDVAEKLGYGNIFLKQNGPPITDDHYYINTIAQIPTINIIHLDAEKPDYSFVPYWHTMKDDMSNISPTTLKIVGEVVLNVIYNE
jgi:Zn-dependent M28 family amino/carboxypeptidase